MEKKNIVSTCMAWTRLINQTATICGKSILLFPTVYTHWHNMTASTLSPHYGGPCDLTVTHCIEGV